MHPPYTSLAEFAATFDDPVAAAPAWVLPEARTSLDALGLRHRVEDVLDTVVALQRAEWLQDGVYLGPSAMPVVYRDVLTCARRLKIAVPPAILASCSVKAQDAYGTDARAFLHLSTFFFDGAAPGERLFLTGRLCGHVAARQVTANTLYALIVDHNGLRSAARKAVGPVLEVFLAPLSLAARLALSRWHRAAEVSADRAGLLCCGDIDAAGLALLRIALGVRPKLTPEAYLAQLRSARADTSPGRWAELLQAEPWMHKRLAALELFARSELYAELGGASPEGARLSKEALDRQTAALLGVR